MGEPLSGYSGSEPTNYTNSCPQKFDFISLERDRWMAVVEYVNVTYSHIHIYIYIPEHSTSPAMLIQMH